jgi:hypothetical protein
MIQIWRLRDNFCAFETHSKMADLKKKIALMKKRQSLCYPTVECNGFVLILIIAKDRGLLCTTGQISSDFQIPGATVVMKLEMHCC